MFFLYYMVATIDWLFFLDEHTDKKGRGNVTNNEWNVENMERKMLIAEEYTSYQ